MDPTVSPAPTGPADDVIHIGGSPTGAIIFIVVCVICILIAVWSRSPDD